MKRTEYLNRCQRWAVSKDKSCLVSYNGSTYSPYGYILTFKPNGQSEHTAMMNDLKANTVYYGVLSKVEDAK
jgi:hypothetical protein